MRRASERERDDPCAGRDGTRVDEIVERAAALRIPVAADRHRRDGHAASITSSRAASFVRHPGRGLRAAAAAVSAVAASTAAPARRRRRALGAHDARGVAVDGADGRPIRAPGDGRRRPARRSPRHRLHRVLGRSVRRRTTWPAMGADVIKVESIQRPDGMRFQSVRPPTQRPTGGSGARCSTTVNLGKRGITLDLGRPAGVELVTRLLAGCRRRGRELLAARDGQPRPRATTSSRAQSAARSWCACRPSVSTVRGATASASRRPWSRSPAWRGSPASPTDRRSCRAARAIRSPACTRWSRCSSRSSTARAPAGASSSRRRWSRRRSTPPPRWCSRHGAYGARLMRDGNRGPVGGAAEPLRVPRRRSLARARRRPTTRSGARCVDVMGRPAWAPRPALATAAGRRARHDAIDAAIAAWCAERDADALVEALLARGIAGRAGRRRRPASATIPQLRARGFFETVVHPVTGAHEHPALPHALRPADRARWFARPAPTLGQHTEEVLRELLGLDDAAIARAPRRRHHRRAPARGVRGEPPHAHPDGGERALGLEGEATHPAVEAKAAAVLVGQWCLERRHAVHARARRCGGKRSRARVRTRTRSGALVG